MEYLQFDFALHITWTTYGTWLPGDARGYVSNTLQDNGFYLPRRNIIGTPYTQDSPTTRKRAASLQKHPTAYLTTRLALGVAEELVEAASQRDWYIARAAVMAAHVHVVVMNCPADGPAVRRILKGTTQARVSKLHRNVRKWFTAGGSDRYKNTPREIENAIRYVARQERMLAGVVAMRPYLVDEEEFEVGIYDFL